MTGPAVIVATLNESTSFIISVQDSNLVSFRIISQEATGANLVRDGADSSFYTFSWTPSAIVESPIVFLAVDALGASTRYQPRIEFCQCLNEATCTAAGLLDQTANPLDLNCICAPGMNSSPRLALALALALDSPSPSLR